MLRPGLSRGISTDTWFESCVGEKGEKEGKLVVDWKGERGRGRFSLCNRSEFCRKPAGSIGITRLWHHGNAPLLTDFLLLLQFSQNHGL